MAIFVQYVRIVYGTAVTGRIRRLSGCVGLLRKTDISEQNKSLFTLVKCGKFQESWTLECNMLDVAKIRTVCMNILPMGLKYIKY